MDAGYPDTRYFCTSGQICDASLAYASRGPAMSGPNQWENSS